MGYLIASVLAVVAVTVAAARFVVSRYPDASFASMVWRSAMAFPVLAVILFACATAFVLLQPSRPDRPDLDPGMPIFAMAMFLFYALTLGVIAGLPTAVVAVRMMRGG